MSGGISSFAIPMRFIPSFNSNSAIPVESKSSSIPIKCGRFECKTTPVPCLLRSRAPPPDFKI